MRVRFQAAGRPWSCIFRNWSRFGSYNVYLNDTRISHKLWLSSSVCLSVFLIIVIPFGETYVRVSHLVCKNFKIVQYVLSLDVIMTWDQLIYLEELNWENVSHRRDKHLSLMVYKALNNKVPQLLKWPFLSNAQIIIPIGQN